VDGGRGASGLNLVMNLTLRLGFEFEFFYYFSPLKAALHLNFKRYQNRLKEVYLVDFQADEFKNE
jgi:hypothetical protein